MLKASHVTKQFGEVCAVEGLNLSVAPGQLFCLLGANGAGKTTTINLFLGFLEPDQGTVTVGGIEPSKNPRAARNQLAYIPENVALYPQLTGLENISLFCELGGTRLRQQDMESLLDRSGLSSEQMRRRVGGYSKGMRQKVGLAIAYAREARALLLDEPLSGLDPAAASDFCEELSRLREAGAAVLMTTHDLFRAKELGGTLGIMRGGKLLEVLEATEVDGQELQQLYLRHMRHEQGGPRARSKRT